MKMAATVVVRMKGCGECPLILAYAARFLTNLSTRFGIAVAACAPRLVLVGIAVPNRNAQDLSRRCSDRALHNQQEHRDEVDEGGMHRVGVYRLGSVRPLRPQQVGTVQSDYSRSGGVATHGSKSIRANRFAAPSSMTGLVNNATTQFVGPMAT